MLLDSLVQARDNGAEIVGLCLGSFVLAYAGILDGKRAATHWEFEHHFQSLFPRVQLDINALYVDDDNIITPPGPPPRWTAACISSVSALVAWLPTRSPVG
ncbi:putative transcriptional regulator [Enterobacter cloacae]|uniref:Putative transcriptional regulator n=1 Tax=Enterobacter cloacae TaxID=550 RepID=A0A377LN94_ENTCL|nr:putative transcriptional regulator [Enterobacter cloacae]